MNGNQFTYTTTPGFRTTTIQMNEDTQMWRECPPLTFYDRRNGTQVRISPTLDNFYNIEQSDDGDIFINGYNVFRPFNSPIRDNNHTPARFLMRQIIDGLTKINNRDIIETDDEIEKMIETEVQNRLKTLDIDKLISLAQQMEGILL